MHAVLGIAKLVRDPVTKGKSDADRHTIYATIKPTTVALARKARVDRGDCTEDTVRALTPHRRHRQ